MVALLVVLKSAQEKPYCSCGVVRFCAVSTFLSQFHYISAYKVYMQYTVGTVGFVKTSTLEGIHCLGTLLYVGAIV